MSGGTGLDVRIPIGGLFTLLGILLASYGLATAGDTALYATSMSVNLNLWWGLVMFVFGALLLWGATRGRRKASAHPAADSPEGRDTEAREHELGLDR
jgi:membrane protein implicated in regulation of membrane protease activity